VSLSPRLALICRLVPPDGGVLVDVGADHGHTAAALGAIATEREPHRLPMRTDVDRVIMDGLKGFRQVDTAVITGMGSHVILRILREGPRPRTIVVHSPQHTDRLRAGLAQDGWRIDAEGLAREGKGFAEVIRAMPGVEPHTGHTLWFGPFLEQDPHFTAHARQRLAYWRQLAQQAPPASQAYPQACAWTKWLEERLALPTTANDG